MSEFEAVNIVIAANIYFDGKVSSRTVKFSDGSIKTLGVMLPGEYEFNTDKPELMELTQGEVDVLLNGATDWQSFQTGDTFHIPGNSSFKITARAVTDYVCSFLDD